ncbi:helix-turn-helix domain-containing protein [Cohnella faecalis]|uniref:ArsR family transcriptional regulator n=1 Tax=Cohnella faecalis TaxID=2315694 RepID=A0A398CR84_9BACL|nr:helix-turn-helix domain-containing protein [Cohnella faecalis]RIE02337.1 ArsR family transcriptional regulator [Cohnella faecalis]
MFENRHAEWIERQAKNRSGESLRRLREGHSHNEKLFAEQIWWPVIGSFECLLAEHEVRNYRDGSYFLDFGYVRPPYKLDWEIDDFSSHAKNINRRNFDYEKERQNQLMLDGWQIYRFSLDAIKERPRHCQQFVLQVLGKLYGGASSQPNDIPLTSQQRDIMRMAAIVRRAITPSEICRTMNVHPQTARKRLSELVQAGLLEPASGDIRVRAYKLGPKAAQRY